MEGREEQAVLSLAYAATAAGFDVMSMTPKDKEIVISTDGCMYELRFPFGPNSYFLTFKQYPCHRVYVWNSVTGSISDEFQQTGKLTDKEVFFLEWTKDINDVMNTWIYNDDDGDVRTFEEVLEDLKAGHLSCKVKSANKTS